MKFVAHPFTNDPSGKMLLGLAFAISKHYSDDLAQKVSRGNRRSFFEGKLWTPKHGYVVEDHFYKPDGHNFTLIKQAWQKRKRKEGIESISKWLNEEGYFKRVKSSKSGKKKITMTMQILSDVFKDPFYYGVIERYGKIIDLREIDEEFQPAVSEADYNAVQSLEYRSIKSTKPHRLAFYPLRQMVLCSVCRRTMRVGPSKGRLGTRYLYYRCDNEACERGKKSIRAKVIFNFISDFLAEGLSFTKKEYDDYIRELTVLAKQRRRRTHRTLQRLRAALKATRGEIEQVSERLMTLDQKSLATKYAEKKLADLEENEIGLAEKIEKVQKKLNDPTHDKVSSQQFLNLSKNAATKVKHGGPAQKDVICRFIFLNLVVDEEKVVDFELKEPFRTLLAERKQRTFSGSGQGRI